ncbi:lysozyme inhibitor LprI family protein [Vibrio mexicanus]|uniref:lysozyme inhibitor LprI family protein n=1 Tax=Vibrio mexicanus TaxID=1004326 RepID=UPI00063CC0A4|nr:lysozyme inhibitor LprI family protein [Vibrio mexicanus]
MKYLLVLLVIFSSCAIASDSCYENKFSSDVLSCQKQLYEFEKKNYEKRIGSILEGKIQNELKSSLIVTEKNWIELAENDCKNYSFYVEETTVTYEIMNLECVTSKYIERTEFLSGLKEMIDSFE